MATKLTPAQQSANEGTIGAFLKATFPALSSGAIAGILGNFQIESAFDPANPSGAPENAIGLAQWENGRRTALDAYATSTGGTETSLVTQEGYLAQELTGPYKSVLSQLEATSNPVTAADIFDKQFEVSTSKSIPEREQAAIHISTSLPDPGTSTASANPSPAPPFPVSSLSPPLTASVSMAMLAWLTGEAGVAGAVAPTTAQWNALPDAIKVSDYALAVTAYNTLNAPITGPVAALEGSLPDWTKSLGKILNEVDNATFWKRVGVIVVGIIVVALGVYLSLRSDGHAPPVGEAVKKAGETGLLA